MSAADALFLQAAVELGERGRFTCAPNPTVGCLIVRNGRVIGRGFHQRTGEAHAEVNAIRDAGGDVVNATVYVSLEPCAFEGRTPACAQTLIDAGVARVVVAARDPHPKVAGSGLKMLRAAGIEADLMTQPSALAAIAGYVSRVTLQRPFVRVKTASSLDGATGLANGESQWITSAEARADVQYWRARSDAIITGVDTIVADDPELNVRATDYLPCQQPLRVILDSTLRTPPASKVVTDNGPTLLVHRADADVPPALDAQTRLALTQGPQDLNALLEALAARGCNEVLVEAGPKVCGSFAAAGFWDEWLCYLAPKWLGSASRPMADFAVAQLAQAPVGKITEVIDIGNDIRIRLEPQQT